MRLCLVFSFVSLALSLAACSGSKLIEPPHVEVVTDAGDYPYPPDYAITEFPEGTAMAASSPCGKACEALRAVGCPEGAPTKQGVSCYQGCLSMARHQRVPTACWISRTSREGVRQCGGIECPEPKPPSHD